jgi:RNA polymerase sigma-70 factor (ECF subfamily)
VSNEQFGGTASEVDPDLVRAVDDAIVDLAGLPPGRADRELGYDPADFAFFYARYQQELARRARRFFLDRRDVDEVVQDTFVKVFLALPELETEESAVRFAHRVLTNLCIDRYRSAQRRPTLVDLSWRADEAATFDDLADPMVRAEDAAVVRDALARLSPDHRAALIKREVEEKDLASIAAEMGVAEPQVKHLLFRARRSLRRLLVGTAVDPRADLSVDEMMEHVGRRAATVSRSSGGRAFVVVLLIAAVCVGAVGLRPGSGSSAPGVAAQPSAASLAPDLGPVAAPEGLDGESAPRSWHTAPLPQARHHRQAGVTVGTAPPITGARGGEVVPTNHPNQNKPSPTGGDTTSGHPTAHRHDYRVTGVVVARHAAVSNQVRVLQSPAHYRSSAQLTAASDQGDFTMVQSVDVSTEGGDVEPGGAVLNLNVPYVDQPVSYLSSAYPQISIARAGRGYVVDVVTTAQPTGTTAGAPTLSVNMTAVYDEALTAVISETVTLAVVPPAAGGSTPKPGPSGTTPSGPPSTVPPSTVPPSTVPTQPADSTSGGWASVDSSGSAPPESASSAQGGASTAS